MTNEYLRTRLTRTFSARTSKQRSFLHPLATDAQASWGLSLYRSGEPAPNRVLPGRCGRRWCFSHSARSPPSAAPKSSPAARIQPQPITIPRLPSMCRACASAILLRPRRPVLLGAMAGRALSDSNRPPTPNPPRTSAPSNPLHWLALSQGKGECCDNNYNCKSGRCTSSDTSGFSRGAFDERCLGAGVWANPAGINSSDGSMIMWPTCWAEATPDKLVEQLEECEKWDARPQTKGTACEAQIEGLGQCDEGRQNGNSCFGAVCRRP